MKKSIPCFHLLTLLHQQLRGNPWIVGGLYGRCLGARRIDAIERWLAGQSDVNPFFDSQSLGHVQRFSGRKGSPHNSNDGCKRM